ncbi:MAG: carbon-nitrogen hydrolase family protein [Candidatus Woesearchaeota archaeon]
MRYPTPTIAIAAMRYYDIHKGDNLPKIREFIHRAKRRGADIICFPESCITKKGALLLTHHYVKEIQAECKKHSIWAIVTEDIMLNDERYNISMLVDREGKIRGKYKKINLYGDRTLPGHKVRVFDTDFGKIGIVICWDITFPKLFDAMKKKGAQIVFCPANWSYDIQAHTCGHKKKEIRLLRSILLARAHENVFFVALVNPLTDDEAQVSYSAISCPHHIIKELIDKEGVITAKVNLKEVHKFRKFYSKED